MDTQDTAQLLSQVKDMTKEAGAGSGMMQGFSPGVIFAGLLFGLIGLAAFTYGKKNVKYRPMFLGLVLMIYPYFVQNILLLYSIGTVLIILLFYPPDR